MIHHFLTTTEITHLTALHAVDFQDTLGWRNSPEGKKWIKKNEGNKPW